MAARASADRAAISLTHLASGDKPAEAAVGETARLLVLAISAVQAVMDPELIVLGGSIGMRSELVERVRALLPRSVPRHVPRRGERARQPCDAWWARWAKR